MRVASPAFVGRVDAMTELTAALQQRPAMVLIEGDPGAGKTRLLHQAAAVPTDGTTLLATCPPLREPFALGPVVDGLRRLADRVRLSGLSPLGGALRPLLPEWADWLPAPLEPLDDPRETRHRMFRALSELMDRLGVDVVVVEDAQWADSSTVEWLLTLAASGRTGLSIVVTYRPHEIPDGSLLPRLTSRGRQGWRHCRIHLGPLEVHEVRDMAASMLRTDEVTDGFARFLHQHTDGNPLAVEETVRLLRDRHELIGPGGSSTVFPAHELPVPPTIRDSVLERIDRLPWETRQVLRAAATLAAPAEAELVVTVAGLNGPPGWRGIGGALSAGLLREAPGGGLEFRHTLAAKAVEEATPISVQWALHRRAAQCLKELDPPPITRLARHFREARDVAEWSRYAEAGAAVALESGDDKTAVLTLLDLLNSAEHPIERRCRLGRKLGEAAFFAAAVLGDLADEVVATLRDLIARFDLPQEERGELRLQLGRMLWRVGREAAAMQEFEAAIPDLGHRPDLAGRAMANLAVPVTPDRSAASHLRWLHQAGTLVGLAGSRLDKLALAVNRATTLLLLGEETGWWAIDEIRESVPEPEEQRLVALGLMNVAEASLAWGRYDETRSLLDAAAAAIRKVNYVRFLTTQQVVATYLDWYRGDWRRIRETAEVLAASEEPEPAYRMRARHLLALLDLAETGRSAEARLRRVVDECARRGIAEPEVTMAPGALARLLIGDGDYPAALEVTAPLAAMIETKDVWLWATDIAPVHVDALVHTGRHAAAEEWVARLAAGMAGRHAPAPEAALATCRAILAEADGSRVAAAALYTEAARQWSALPRPYESLQTRERLGRCLLTAGKVTEAISALADVEQGMRRLGANWDADRVASLLREHGIEVARTWRRGRRGYGGELSPRERECVSLVVQGMRNKQVAERLFLSPRTVERHLRSAMRKLDVSTRTALALAAIERGVVPPPTRTSSLRAINE